MKRILVIDNYDSFVNNIIHLIKENSDIVVERACNNQIDFNRLGDYDALLLSPGPGLPNGAGSLMKCIDQCSGSHKIVGVCLGHQALYEYFGGRLIQLDPVRHGHKTPVRLTGMYDALLRYIPSDATAGLYNSWTADPAFVPEELVITSVDDTGAILSFRHRSLPLHGIQFHPESVMSNCGKDIVRA
ncbi:MAG: aminodeoxychorismate/anthranilate synthase component II, partial [Bacteroidales bacterium]|nr:aminodeoxychorismate/anthranilate synthase component II [Bacteroidales bacterium]